MAKRNAHSPITYTAAIKPIPMSDDEWLEAQRAVASLVAQAYWDRSQLTYNSLLEFLKTTTWSSLPPNVIASDSPQIHTIPVSGDSEAIDRLLLRALLFLDLEVPIIEGTERGRM